jgi:hypothetical protein
VFATLRNTSIGYHRSNGETNIARATRRANRRSTDLIDAVTESNRLRMTLTLRGRSCHICPWPEAGGSN